MSDVVEPHVPGGVQRQGGGPARETDGNGGDGGGVPKTVHDSVAETLRDLGGSASAAPTREGGEPRPVFAELQLVPVAEGTAVDVTLSLAGRTVTTRAAGAADERAVARTAAEAVLAGLERFLEHRAELTLAWFKVLEPEGYFGHLVVHCAVACRTARGRDLYVGSALNRGDLAVASVRSALDAVNRPFARFLYAESMRADAEPPGPPGD